MQNSHNKCIGRHELNRRCNLKIYWKLFPIGVVGAILIGGAILIICVSNFRNHRD